MEKNYNILTNKFTVIVSYNTIIKKYDKCRYAAPSYVSYNIDHSTSPTPLSFSIGFLETNPIEFGRSFK